MVGLPIIDEVKKDVFMFIKPPDIYDVMSRNEKVEYLGTWKDHKFEPYYKYNVKEAVDFAWQLAKDASNFATRFAREMKGI